MNNGLSINPIKSHQFHQIPSIPIISGRFCRTLGEAPTTPEKTQLPEEAVCRTWQCKAAISMGTIILGIG